MLNRIADSKPVRWVRRTATAAMDSVVGRSAERLSGSRPGVLASAIAYNLFFASVPLVFGFIALVSLLGQDEQAMAELEVVLGDAGLPDQVVAFITDLLTGAQEVLGDATITAAVIALAVALWSGSRAALTLIEALQVIEREEDPRSFVQKRLVGMLSSAGIILSIVAVVLTVVLSEAIIGALEQLGFEEASGLVEALALPLGALVVVLFFAGFFRWAPPEPLPGAWTATFVSVAGIGLASWGLSFVAGLDVFTGSTTFAILGSVAFVLLWMYVIAYVIIVAASFAVTMARPEAEPEVWTA